MRLIAVLLASILALTACGGSDDEEEDSASRSAGMFGANDESSAPTVEILESGFGQSDDGYLQGIAIVTTGDEAAVGEFVTVSMNFLDASGAILLTQEQVESFHWVGQELVVPVWPAGDQLAPGIVASVEASASISDYGTDGEEWAPLATVDATDPGSSTFELTNEMDADLEDLRVGVVCRDAGGTIVGGGSGYPSLVAAGQTIRLTVPVRTSGSPATCTAHPNYGDF